MEHHLKFDDEEKDVVDRESGAGTENDFGFKEQIDLNDYNLIGGRLECFTTGAQFEDTYLSVPLKKNRLETYNFDPKFFASGKEREKVKHGIVLRLDESADNQYDFLKEENMHKWERLMNGLNLNENVGGAVIFRDQRPVGVTLDEETDGLDKKSAELFKSVVSKFNLKILQFTDLYFDLPSVELLTEVIKRDTLFHLEFSYRCIFSFEGYKALCSSLTKLKKLRELHICGIDFFYYGEAIGGEEERWLRPKMLLRQKSVEILEESFIDAHEAIAEENDCGRTEHLDLRGLMAAGSAANIRYLNLTGFDFTFTPTRYLNLICFDQLLIELKNNLVELKLDRCCFFHPESWIFFRNLFSLQESVSDLRLSKLSFTNSGYFLDDKATMIRRFISHNLSIKDFTFERFDHVVGDQDSKECEAVNAWAETHGRYFRRFQIL